MGGATFRSLSSILRILAAILHRIFRCRAHSAVEFSATGYILHNPISAARAAAIVSLTVLYDWNANRSRYIPDEGYREASAAAMFDAHDGVRYCAIGGARSVWRYYIHQPIAIPASVNELQKLGKIAGEVRCLYYEASWQSEEQRKIAEFLRQHGNWQKIRELTVFRYAANQNTGVIGPRDEKLSEG